MSYGAPRLLMLGAGAELRSSACTVVETYRSSGLFRRWPITYVATHAGGAAAQRASCALKGAGEFAALLAQHRRVALHVHTASGGAFWRDCAYLSVAFAARARVLLHLHGGDFDRFYDASGPAARATMRYMLERATRVAADAPKTAAWVRSVAPQAQVRWLPSPVEVATPSPAERPNLIVFPARLDAENGIFDLLQAVAELREVIPDIRLACIGSGERPAVAREAERLGIADTVKFLEWLGPCGKRALLENAAVCAMPLHAGGLPLAVLEAMAAAVPVVAAAVGDIPEVLADGVSGLLVPAGDARTLQRQLRKVLLDRRLAANLGAAARETVRLRFTPERVIPLLEALYHDLGVTPLFEAAEPMPPELRRAA